MEFISSQCAQHPSLASKYEKLSDLYNQKLWHQLSQALSEFISEEANCVGDNLHLLYTEFIAHFEARLNQVELSILVSKIGHSFQEPEKALNLFEEVLKSRTRLGAEATVCLEMDICLVRLRMNQVDDVKKILEGTKENISTIASSETIVFSKYHKATAEYLKVCRVVLSFLLLLDSFFCVQSFCTCYFVTYNRKNLNHFTRKTH
jgi:26S proteasome regulatory subunit N9